MNASDRFGLKSNAIKLLRSVFSRYPSIEVVILYGSRAKGNFKPSSDIDLTIVGPQVDLSIRFKIENEIDDLLLPYKVDLSLFHQIDNLELIDHIKRVGVEFYKR